MNAMEMRYALQIAGDIEASVGTLYKGFADRAATPEAAQFWRLLSYEEKTHSHMMELISERVQDDWHWPDAQVPAALCHHLEGLLKLQALVHGLLREEEMASDPFWQVRIASDLEHSEIDGVLDWLLKLPVDPDIRGVIAEMTRGTTDHAERIKAYGEKLDQKLPEIANR